VAIDSVIEKRLDALDALESQFYEGGANGSADLIPAEPAKQLERKREVRASFQKRYASLANRFRSNLVEWYGEAQGKEVKYAEAFEICEYGRRPDKEELKKLFPFYGK